MMNGVLATFSQSLPAVADHLWQSTVFVLAVWAATLLLGRNRARVRYALWMAASLKFLIPLSLLVGLGDLLSAPQQAAAAPQVAAYAIFDVVGRPFEGLRFEGSLIAGLGHLGMQLMPGVLAVGWLCGSGVVLVVWLGRWRQVSALKRRARLVLPVSAETGREAEILRRLEAGREAIRAVPLYMTDELMEPGIFGIWRPVLLWPERLSERLENEHIEAILAHELMHVARYDNLTAAMHMVVEAIFWFHPLVWWMEARLVEEREQACDEAVVLLGGRREAYAESLLKACRFCVESPLACVSGISGADLRQRIVRIMSRRGALNLNLQRKLALVAAALVVVAVPLVFGQVRGTLRLPAIAAPPPPPPPPPPPSWFTERDLHQQ
jgi:beta-lactamase regulating signal transducer with metallopeptidase domain